jgi:hypothetical protein
MGQLLFWLEAVVATVLWSAFATAVVCRTRRGRRRWLAAIPCAVPAVLPWVVAIGTFALVEIGAGGALVPLISASAACAAFAAAAAVVIKRGTRPSGFAAARIAATWPLSRLAMAWGAAALLTLITFWNLDLAVRQEMATLRAEAGAVALSLSPPRVPRSENAAGLYRQAWGILEAQQDTPKPWGRAVAEWEGAGPIGAAFSPHDEQMLAFLRKHRAVIKLLHRAAARPACNFGTEYYPPSISLLVPSLRRMRSLGRLLCLSSRVNAHRGRIVESAEDLAAALAAAEHISTAEPVLVGAWVAYGLEARAVEALQYLLEQEQLTNEGLNALRVNPSLSFNEVLHRSLRMETAGGLSVFAMLDFSGALHHTFLAHLPWGKSLCSAAHPYRVFLWRQDAAAYLKCMRRYQALSAKPYHVHAKQWRKGQRTPKRRRGGILTTALAPSLWRTGQNAAKADARHRLVLLAVAMWRYRLKNGSFPERLAQLVPAYLSAVPVDPFTGRPMRMGKAAGRLAIYSVGPDLSDDGGTPFDRKTSKGDLTLVLSR